MAQQDLYARIKPKTGSTSFYRAGFQHTLKWVLLEGLDNATVEALEGEQMLETSKDKPADFDAQQAAAAAEVAAGSVPPDPETGLIGSGIQPVVLYFDGGFEIDRLDLLKQAFAATGLSVTGFNELPQDAREVLLQVYADQLNAEHVALAAIKATVTDLNNQLSTANSNLTSMTSSRDALNGQISTLNSTVTTVTGERDGFKNQVTSLQSQVTELQAELKTAKAAAAKPAAKSAAKKAD